MKKITLFPILLMAFGPLTGCTEEVPPGYVGMVMTVNGLEGNLLQPGRHSCWGRDKLILVETKEQNVPERLSILCKDDLNFKFDLNVRSRLRNMKKPTDFTEVLKRKGADMVQLDKTRRVLKYDVMYKTYVQPVARSLARGEVSKYQTTQVRDNREAIEKGILTKFINAMAGTPMEVITITTSNFDYPDVITAAVEKKRQREIEIDEEKANQAKELLKAENRLKLAQKMKMVKAAEAEADAVGIKILGKALTPTYLKWKAIERDRMLYERVGQGDKLIVTGNGPAVPIFAGTGK